MKCDKCGADTPQPEGGECLSELIPTNWLDPLLTGPNAAIGKPPYTGTDIENLLRLLKRRVENAERDRMLCPMNNDERKS